MADEKIKIRKEVYDALVQWRDGNKLEVVPILSVGVSTLIDMPAVVDEWWYDNKSSNLECNNRIIAIIRWVNGEDVFEVEKPKKWVVRSKETDEYGDYRYICLADYAGITNIKFVVENGNATKFDTKEEAESWANAHQEVIEVEE